MNFGLKRALRLKEKPPKEIISAKREYFGWKGLMVKCCKAEGHCGRNQKTLTAVRCGRKSDRNSYSRTLIQVCFTVYILRKCELASYSSFTPTFPNDTKEKWRLRPALLRRAWLLVRERSSGTEHHGRIWRALQGAKICHYKSYRTHGIVKNKIESFSSIFSISYDSMSSACNLSHALAPRNPKQNL